MKFLPSLILFTLFNSNFCQLINVEHKFEIINKKVLKFNAMEAKISWDWSINPNDRDIADRASNYQKKRIKWRSDTCEMLVDLNNQQLLNTTQLRQAYLLCRGPKFTFDEAREMSYIYEELKSLYSEAEICIPSSKHVTVGNLQEAEAAILEYLSSVKYFSNFDQKLPAAPSKGNVVKDKDTFCLEAEDDFDKLMKYSKNEEVLKWLWVVWRQEVSAPMRQLYEDLVQIQNYAARRNGYVDFGATWRDEIEIPELRRLSRHLYSEIRSLYEILHGVVRFYLRRHYGDIVPERGPIPAHLLGNLWSQNWESLIDLITPKTINLDNSIKDLNKSVLYLVKRAEDFYQSLGLPAMTASFWYESVFAKKIHLKAPCHGSAADMFQRGDFRLLYCSGTSSEDFYVLHHELGHIQYFMAYENQAPIFRQANPALHETIGDTIMYGVLTPQHLNRLRLINDSLLYGITPTTPKTTLKPYKVTVKTKDDVKAKVLDFIEATYNAINKTKDEYWTPFKTTQYSVANETSTEQTVGIKNLATTPKMKYDTDDEILNAITTEEILMLKLALNKIPQIPFSLLVDEYRFKYLEGSIDKERANQAFWKMALKMQGIAPPVKMGEKFFDIAAKFHVPDNTPYTRYFLSSFLQHQLFEVLCKASVFGHRGEKEALPERITMNRCDIYGSKAAGMILKDLMSRGNSQHWREILQETTGINEINAYALKRYYRPLYKLLYKLVRAHNIPIGW